MTVIYLDSHATTRPSRRVIAAVNRAMRCCGNAASSHLPGQEVAGMVERARDQVAAAAGGIAPGRVVFTSGATEANNLALRGTLAAARRDGLPGRRIIISAVEHSSVIATARALAAQGEAVLTVLPVDAEGAVDPAVLARALGPDVVLVSIMHANNEVGTINDIEALSAACRAARALFHVDACQSFAKVPLRPGVADFISASGHKLHGPTGVGALLVGSLRLRDWLVPQQTGGTHESGVRAGTTNAHAIVGFGEAAEATRAEWAAGEGARLRRMRDALWASLLRGIGPAWLRLNGPADFDRRLPQNLNVNFVGVCPFNLDAATRARVAVSSAAACRSLGGERSHVLEAIGSPDDGATIRFGLGEATEAEVRAAARLFIDAANALRGHGCVIPQR